MALAEYFLYKKMRMLLKETFSVKNYNGIS